MKVKELLKNNGEKKYIAIAGRAILWMGTAKEILENASTTLLNAKIDEIEKWGKNEDALYIDSFSDEEVNEVARSYTKSYMNGRIRL